MDYINSSFLLVLLFTLVHSLDILFRYSFCSCLIFTCDRKGKERLHWFTSNNSSFIDVFIHIGALLIIYLPFSSPRILSQRYLGKRNYTDIYKITLFFLLSFFFSYQYIYQISFFFFFFSRILSSRFTRKRKREKIGIHKIILLSLLISLLILIHSVTFFPRIFSQKFIEEKKRNYIGVYKVIFFH